jgi:serine/threonine protein kinase
MINLEVNQFGNVVKSNNYDNQQQACFGNGNYQQQHFQQQQQQQMMHQVPQFQMPHSIQHMQQQQFVQQQQHQHISSECDFSVKQISANNLRLMQEIGKGRFGPLYIGELISQMNQKVIIKTLINKKKRNTTTNTGNMLGITSTPMIHNPNIQSNNEINLPTTTAEAHFMEQEFYNEISLYSSLHNKHIANLIGVHTQPIKDQPDDENDCAMSMLTDDDDTPTTTTTPPQCMIFEHLNNGDLHEYLSHRVKYPGMMPAGSQSNLSAASSSIGAASSSSVNYLNQQRNIADFLYIGQQIAAGMEYLSSQNFIIKDLATRNILMSDNLTCKISIDLCGQYKEQYSRDYYKFQSRLLPVRWMSPESLLYGRYTQQSDVWSYGVCLWEIFNFGCQPYSGCTNPEAIEMIRDRQLLLIPDECPQRAYALMLECWHEIAMQRPTFAEILNRLRNWENYYLFNNQNQNQNQVVQAPPPLPPPPMQQQQQVPLFQMTASYSSNSQNSKASSLLGNTASTGISSCSSPPPPLLPPPLQINQHGLFSTQSHMYASPSKNLHMQTSTNLFAAKFLADPAVNSLRLSQRNFHQQPSTFNSGNNLNHIPINDHFEL